MTDLTPYFAALDATWPAAQTQDCGPFILRKGNGGGKRVSAATARALAGSEQIAQAAQAMYALDQTPLFMIRPGDEALDSELAARGYRCVDPTNLRSAPLDALAAQDIPHVSAFELWEPLQIMNEIWQAGGISGPRRAVMARAKGPKTAVLGRSNDRAAGVAFVAVHGQIAMCHALEVEPAQRRQKTAVNMMRMAARWAQDQGASQLAVLVTQDNIGANALYTSLGLDVVGQYHYRIQEPQ